MTELLCDSDGVARATLVSVSNGNGPTKVLKRSIRHLIPVKVNDGDGRDKESTNNNDTTATDDCSRASLLEDADDTIILSDLGLTAGCSIRRGC